MDKRKEKESDLQWQRTSCSAAERKNAEAKSHQAVMSLIDNEIGLAANGIDADETSSAAFIATCRMLTPALYDDVVLERAIASICGYPLCPSALKAANAKQQFRIDGRTNKLYDITYRKNFCSDQCCLRSQYVKNQLSDSPVWVRDDENFTHPDVQLVTVAEAGSGMKGDVVRLNS